MHQTKSYSNEQMSLNIMETFKGQGNKEEAKLCRENNCILIIVIHNLYITYILPLDITFNKSEKNFIKEKYKIWYTEQATKQLNKGKNPADVEVSLNLSQIKPLHANRIFERCKYLQGRIDLIINGFKVAGISEAVVKAYKALHEIKHLFIVHQSEQD